MAYSDSFPATRPVFQADFANGGRVDPRISYSRSTTGTYFGTDKHLSSENLFTHSASSYLWATYNGASKADGAANGPDGSTNTAYSITFNNTSQYVNTGSVGLDTSASYTFSFYAKVASGTQTIIIGNIATGVFSNVTVTTDWQRFTVTQTPTATTRYPYIGPDGATGLGTLLIWGAQLEKRGSATALNETSGQIHREYAPTLQTAAINAPRFEFSASDSASAAMGESLGLLVEGQAQNLIPYSSAINSWVTKGNVTISDAAAIGPDGTLSASLVRPTGATSLQHYIRENITTVASSSYTFSAYVKPAGYTKLLLVGEQTAHPYTDYANATFTLTGDGSVTTSAGSATITALSDGWYRITATGTAATTSSYALMSVLNDAGDLFYTADSYSGILITAVQFEQNSFQSSYIATSGSAVTRAADSASLAMSSAGVSQGPVSAVVEGSAGSGNGPYLLSLSDGTGANRSSLSRDSTTADTSTNYRFYVRTDNSAVASLLLFDSASATKFAMRIDTDDFAACAGGGTVVTDTAGVAPVTTTIHIATAYNGVYQANGHVKRIALYGEALSDTNLQALTK